MAEYIEREALSQWCHETMSVQSTTAGMMFVREFWNKVMDTPAADVAPVVHGRWINKTDINRALVEQRVDCSVCGHIFWHTSALSYNYCPNCGARMDGE